MTEGPLVRPPGRLPARDLVDVRLAAAIEAGGCAICHVRGRAEQGMLDTTVAERVLDLGFRAGLERDHAFCRRHITALLVADRQASGILGSSILFGAMIERRVGALRAALEAHGRRRRSLLATARARPGCLICDQGAQAVQTAVHRLVERCADPAWTDVIRDVPLCMDDLVLLLIQGGDDPALATVADAQLTRLDDLRARLEGYAHHSTQDRRHLLTDAERSAADEAARVLGGE